MSIVRPGIYGMMLTASTGNPGGAWRMPVIFEWKTLGSLYGSKTQTAKVVLKSTWCSFCLKVQQRRAHDVSQVRRRPIFYTGRRRERSG